MASRCTREKIDATQHFTEPPPRFTEATLVKRMEELGIGRPSTYASTLATLRDRDYVRLDKKRLIPEDKGRLVVAFLESFFSRYVEFDFTASLEEKLDLVSNNEIDWKQVLRDFWKDFSAAVNETKDLRTTQVLDSLNELLGPHIFPAKEDGSDPRLCPACSAGQLSLKVGKFGAFIGCSNYPECRYTRTLSPPTGDAAENARPGVKVLGQDPETGAEITLRDGRFGAYVQEGEQEEGGEKPKRASLPKNIKPDDLTLQQALALLSLPREVAKHPTTGEPIVANIGRFGPYVQHGKTYANVGRDDDVLTIGANRAIDLIVQKESGGGGSRFSRASEPGRVARRPSRGRRGDGEGRSLWSLCELGQGQRHHPARRRPGVADAGAGAGDDRRQGRRRRRDRRARARRASRWRNHHRARRAFRALRESRQGQRHPAQEHVRRGCDARRRDQIHRGKGRRAEEEGAGEKGSRQESSGEEGHCRQ